jgi:hypothetical protein
MRTAGARIGAIGTPGATRKVHAEATTMCSMVVEREYWGHGVGSLAS